MGKRVQFFTPNDPHQMRIYPELAREIGFNESIVLLQLEYLIGISNTEEHDGQIWTYQSLEELRDKFFPWWSPSTISRIIKSLEAKHLLQVGNYNRLTFDRTQWFAINWDECSKLNSLLVNDAIFQNEKSRRSNCKMHPVNLQNACGQNETTIPENPIPENPEPETPLKIGADAPTPPKDESKKSKKVSDPRLKEPALIAYREIAHLHIPESWRDQVIEQVTNLDLWKTVIRDWIGIGWNKQNITGLLDAYSKGGIPANGKNGSTGKRLSKSDIARKAFEIKE